MEAHRPQPVETLHQKGRTVRRKPFEAACGDIQSGLAGHLHNGVFPRGDIGFVAMARKLGDPKGAFGIADVCLGARASQRGAGGDQHGEPFFVFVRRLLAFQMATGFLQFPEPGPRRRGHHSVVVLEIPVRRKFEPQRAHSGFIEHPEEIIRLPQRPRLFTRVFGAKSLATLHEFAPPAIRCGIHEKAEIRLVGKLPPRVKAQIRIQRRQVRPMQESVVERERKELLPAQRLCREDAQRARFSFRTMVEIDENVAVAHASPRLLARRRSFKPRSCNLRPSSSSEATFRRSFSSPSVTSTCT